MSIQKTLCCKKNYTKMKSYKSLLPYILHIITTYKICENELQSVPPQDTLSIRENLERITFLYLNKKEAVQGVTASISLSFGVVLLISLNHF